MSCIASSRFSRRRPHEEKLWNALFSRPWEWWDNRRNKTSCRQPDFRHKISRDPLWLNSLQKPPWVGVRISQLDSPQLIEFAQIGRQVQCLCDKDMLDTALHSLSLTASFPSEFVYLSLLKSCNDHRTLAHVSRLHAHLAHHGLDSTGFIGDYLVVTLAKCGGLEDASNLFHRLPYKTVFSWTTMISAYADHKKGYEGLNMYERMIQQDVKPDTFTFASVIKACACTADLEEGKRIHGDAREAGFASDVVVGSALISMYSKCGSLKEAEFAFTALLHRNTVSWNAMLSAYVEHGCGGNALQLFRQMQTECVKSDQRTFVIVLQACCILARNEDSSLTESQRCKAMALEIGQAFHAYLRKQGMALDIYVNNVLLSLYAKCGSIKEAENVFCGMTESNCDSWNEIAAAYVEEAYAERALQLYILMQQSNVHPNQWSFVIYLQACCILADKEKIVFVDESQLKLMSFEIGRALHNDAEKRSLTYHLFVGNSFVRMYGKCLATAEAENVFCQLPKRDTVSWNALFSAYIEQSGHQEKVLTLFKIMQEGGHKPDDITLVYMLRACGGTTGSWHLCLLIHFIVLSFECDASPLLANALVHAYGSCSSMMDAQAVFDRLPKKDVVSWNSLITGYAQDGNFDACINNFEKMQNTGVQPDGITFLSMFFACSHSGIIEKGTEFFRSMWKYGIGLEIKHCGSVLDLLGRAGDFSSLENMLWKIPMQPDVTVWSLLLGACQTHNNRRLAEHAFHYAVDEHPEEVPSYVLLSNICAKE